jgi:hypothetical protein
MEAEEAGSLSLVEYQQKILVELEGLYEFAQSTSELKYVLTRNWTDRVKEVVCSWGPEREFTDGGYNLYRILVPPFSDIAPQELEEVLSTVSEEARKQQKLVPYRKTRNELKSEQNNQILSAIFETIILSRLLNNNSSVILYPPISTDSNRDVEASISIDGRTIFIEAKALGYSGYDPIGSVGSQSIESPKKQVRDALVEKLGNCSNLGFLDQDSPTVLCLALGFNADEVTSRWAIHDFFCNSSSNVSLIVVFESAFCRQNVHFFFNPSTSLALTKAEVEFFHNL